LKGHLHITCACDEKGRNFISEQSFSAPMHLSKPHEDAGCLVVNLVNPTAGLFDGDEVEIIARVQPRAHLVLTTPSASRIYHSRSGRPAIVTQRILAGEGSFVEFYPEPIIPQGGAIYDQRTLINVAENAEVMFFEWLAPGRVASGEAFLYRQLSWQTEILASEKLVVRERYRISPSDPASLASLTTKFACAHYLGAFILSEKPFPEAEVSALNDDSTYLGWSPLRQGGWSVKALCADSLSTRRLLRKLRGIFYQSLGREMPSLGRF